MNKKSKGKKKISSQIIEIEENIVYLRNLLYLIKSSTFFRVWQLYCNVRDLLLGKREEEFNVPYIKEKGLKEKLYNLRLVQKSLRKQLKKINSAQSYKVWLHYIEVINKFSQKLKKYVPKSIRIRFKAILRVSAFLRFSPIDKNIKKEWEIWTEKRPKGSLDIINFGITTFTYRFQRAQHLATQLSNIGHRVFYIESEFIPVFSERFIKTPIKVRKYSKNIYLITLTASRDMFIYRDIPTQKDIEFIMFSIKKLIYEAKIINPIAKIDHPFWSSIINKLSLPIIYDCMDEHVGFKESGKDLINYETKLIKESDLVLVSSNYLFNKNIKQNPQKILILKNACDFNTFFQATNTNVSMPFDLMKTSKPIIGYFGSISEWFDTELLNRIAIDYSNCSIVLIGRVQNKRVWSLAKKYKNIHLLGEKPYQSLPQYLKYFDVCIIPFIINDLIKATDPVKLYEYCAAGKPVVTTNVPELKDFEKLIYLSRNQNEFLMNIKKALNEKGSKLISARIEMAKINTWSQRSNALNNTLNQLFFPRISVVIVANNKFEYTAECLKSLLHRSFYPNLEIIVVDNASDEKTIEKLKQLSLKESIKVIYNHENFSFAKANNIGLKNISGDYIIILNNDTIITPGSISRLIFYIKNSHIGLVGPVTNNVGNEAKINILYNSKNRKELEDAALNYTSNHWGETIELDRIAAFCWIERRTVYDKIGNFDERFTPYLFEDDDYCIRIKKAGYKIICAEDIFIHHYLGASISEINRNQYRTYFEKNKKRLEQKWNMVWIPHKYRSGVK